MPQCPAFVGCDKEQVLARTAQAIIASLTPHTRLTNGSLAAMRIAAGCAREAAEGRPSKAALDDARTEAATVLGGLEGLIEVNAVKLDMIEQAHRAVAVWLGELGRLRADAIP